MNDFQNKLDCEKPVSHVIIHLLNVGLQNKDKKIGRRLCGERTRASGGVRKDTGEVTVNKVHDVESVKMPIILYNEYVLHSIVIV